MADPPVILHADMDAFFAAVEQRDHPEWRGKPVIVGATEARGVVAAASYEARQFGVHSAMPGFRARQLCPHGVFVKGNMAHYAAVSAELHEIFKSFTPLVEPLALDEAFLDITGSLGLFGEPREVAEQVKRAVLERTQLNVSVGVGPSKLVAKLACSLSKPNGLSVVNPADVEGLLRPLPVGRLWGIGPTIASKLEAAGVHTLGELAYCELTLLRPILGARTEEVRLRARGVDPRPVVAERQPKSIGEEATFDADVVDRAVIVAALHAHSEGVARRLRRSGYRAQTVSIKVKLGRRKFPSDTESADELPARDLYPLLCRSQGLPTASDDGSRLARFAVELWDRAAVAEPVRLLGVTASGLVPTANEQLDLFPSPRDTLGTALDAINARFGDGAVRRGGLAPSKVTFSGRAKVGES